MRASVIAAAFLAACAQAVQVTSPAKGQVIDLSLGFKVTFETVSTDPTSAHLFLVNMAGGSTPYSQDLGEIDLTKGSYFVTVDDVPPQKGYQFNIQSVEEYNTGILAQSQQFEVKAGSKSPKPSSYEETSASATASASVSSITVVSSSAYPTATSDAVASGTSTLATVISTSAPAASSTSVVEAGAPAGKVVAGGSLLALAVAGLIAVVA